jgi:hypothetical protein
VTIHDKGVGTTLLSNIVHFKAAAPGTARGKFIHLAAPGTARGKFDHPGCSELYVILACLMSSIVVKQCCDKCSFKVGNI